MKFKRGLTINRFAEEFSRFCDGNESNALIRIRKMKEAGLLVMGGFGPSPFMTKPEDAALILMAVGGTDNASTVVEAVKLFSKLQPVNEDFVWLGESSFLGCLANAFGDNECAYNLVEINLSRNFYGSSAFPELKMFMEGEPSAKIVYRVGEEICTQKFFLRSVLKKYPNRPKYEPLFTRTVSFSGMAIHQLHIDLFANHSWGFEGDKDEETEKTGSA